MKETITKFYLALKTLNDRVNSFISGNRFIVFITIIYLIISAVVLALTIRGYSGNPDAKTINSTKWKDNGPFELSPERGRYALTYSFIENNSFYFSTDLARFVVPDLGYKNGHYVSLFAPSVSFLIMPGYIIGKYFNLAQVGSFATVALFALLNVFLIRLISIRLGANPYAALLAAGTFLFATPAFSYSGTIYEHHFSTFLILVSIYCLLRWNNFWSLAVIWFCCAFSISVDNPNVFFMAPIGLFALGRLISIKLDRQITKIKILLPRFLTFFVMLIPLLFFFWVNYSAYGSGFQLAGTVASVHEIDAQGKPVTPKAQVEKNIISLKNPAPEQKSIIKFFKSRNLLNGMYILFLSPDRGTLYFTPVILLGLFGAAILFKKKQAFTILLISIVGVIFLLYSMWGDPWGGWSFGPRYLIPAFAIVAIFLSLVLTRFRKNIFVIIFFFLLFGYSTYVNTIGALSSNANPPQVEVLALEKLSGKQEKYTYERDLDLIKLNKSKSFVWQTYLVNNFTAVEFLNYMLLTLFVTHGLLSLGLFTAKKGNLNEI